MKKWSFFLGIIILAVIVVFIVDKSGLIKTMSHEDLEIAIEVVDVETKWVEKYYQPWPPRLVLVPAISFRVKNLSAEPMRYINFNAIFRFKDDFENLGDSFLAAVRENPIPPGEKSEVILLKSNYGVEGKNLATFASNPQWKLVIVKLFAQSKGSQFIPLGEWDVSREIDFKEPEPVGTEPTEKPAEKK